MGNIKLRNYIKTWILSVYFFQIKYQYMIWLSQKDFFILAKLDFMDIDGIEMTK